MDPISIAIEIELGALLLAAVGGIFTWMNNDHQKARRRQREAHHRELTQLRRQHHLERMAALRATKDVAEEAIDVVEEVAKPVRRRPAAAKR